jgi:hypothetical protein
VQAICRSWERQENGFSLTNSRGDAVLLPGFTDFNPVRSVSGFLTSGTLKEGSAVLNYYVGSNLLQQQ